MHSNSIGCPQIFPLSAPVLYWLSHLTCISSLRAKNERKTLIFTQLKISRYNQHVFAIFRRILHNMTSDLLTAVCPETKAQNALAARRFASTLVAINPPLPAPKPRTKFDSTKRRPQEEVKKKINALTTRLDLPRARHKRNGKQQLQSCCGETKLRCTYQRGWGRKRVHWRELRSMERWRELHPHVRQRQR